MRQSGANQTAIRVISSMATRHMLADLASRFETATSRPVFVESVGGVDAAKRVAGGEAFDVVVLASAALDALVTGGSIVQGSRVDLARSPMAVAVRAGASRPDIRSDAAVREAVTTARRIGYSTGPSGTHLKALVERWGLTEALKDRLVQAPPGIPVGTLVVDGDVDLGFQQLCELTGVDGVDVLGPLPSSIQSMTTFAGGIAAASTQQEHARDLLAFMAAPSVAEIKREHGMVPA